MPKRKDEEEESISESESITSDDKEENDTDIDEDEDENGTVDEEQTDNSDNESNKSTEIKKNECAYSTIHQTSHMEDIEPIKKTFVTKENRITKPLLTKYERVRILSERVKQLTGMAKPMIKNYEKMSPKEIAYAELKAKTIPYYIDRTLPNGNRERWELGELMI